MIRTYSGRMVNPLDLKPDDIDIIDIAHSLSNICRYGGHGLFNYSVAQHSVLLALMAPRMIGADSPDEAMWLMRAFLLHDACEAYIGADIVTPVKRALGIPPELEEDIIARVYEKYGLDFTIYQRLKHYDLAICTNEKDALWPTRVRSPGEPEGIPGLAIVPWSHEFAEAQFLQLFKQVTEEGVFYHEH
jgi:hypothetical protein